MCTCVCVCAFNRNSLKDQEFKNPSHQFLCLWNFSIILQNIR